jgi:hypothetical protein
MPDNSSTISFPATTGAVAPGKLAPTTNLNISVCLIVENYAVIISSFILFF